MDRKILDAYGSFGPAGNGIKVFIEGTVADAFDLMQELKPLTAEPV